MRISDWSSAVCSSDLGPARDLAAKADGEVRADQSEPPRSLVVSIFVNGDDDRDHQDECKDRKRDIGHMVHLVGRSAALDARWRSEEHTSELQSLMRISYAVFCLKTKKKHIIPIANRSTTSTTSTHTLPQQLSTKHKPLLIY